MRFFAFLRNFGVLTADPALLLLELSEGRLAVVAGHRPLRAFHGVVRLLVHEHFPHHLLHARVCTRTVCDGVLDIGIARPYEHLDIDPEAANAARDAEAVGDFLDSEGGFGRFEVQILPGGGKALVTHPEPAGSIAIAVGVFDGHVQASYIAVADGSELFPEFIVNIAGKNGPDRSQEDGKCQY